MATVATVVRMRLGRSKKCSFLGECLSNVDVLKPPAIIRKRVVKYEPVGVKVLFCINSGRAGQVVRKVSEERV